MEIREMTDRQHLAYLKGRIESKLDLMSVPSNEHIMDEVYHDVEELIVWLDGLIEDDMPIIVDCLGDQIPDITFADSISKAQAPVNITTPVTMEFASKTTDKQEPSRFADRIDKSVAALNTEPPPMRIPAKKQTQGAVLKKTSWSGKTKTITKEDVLAKVNIDDYTDIPTLTSAILEKCNCTNTSLQKLLGIDSSALSSVINKNKVYPYVEKEFRRVFQFPRPIPIPSERHAEAAALGLQCAKTTSKES